MTDDSSVPGMPRQALCAGVKEPRKLAGASDSDFPELSLVVLEDVVAADALLPGEGYDAFLALSGLPDGEALVLTVDLRLALAALHVACVDAPDGRVRVLGDGEDGVRLFGERSGCGVLALAHGELMRDGAQRVEELGERELDQLDVVVDYRRDRTGGEDFFRDVLKRHCSSAPSRGFGRPHRRGLKLLFPFISRRRHRARGLLRRCFAECVSIADDRILGSARAAVYRKSGGIIPHPDPTRNGASKPAKNARLRVKFAPLRVALRGKSDALHLLHQFRTCPP